MSAQKTTLGKRNNRWYVVASRTRARIFRKKNLTSELELLETFENPDGRSKGREFSRHSVGKGYSNAKLGSGRAYRLASHADPHEQVAQQFAKKVASYLDKKVKSGSIDKVIIVAEPHVLGLLKKGISGKTAECLGRSIRKDLDKVKDINIAKYLV